MSFVDQEWVLERVSKLGGQAQVRELYSAARSEGLQEIESGASGNISKRLSQLAKWGLVIKVKRGLYRLPSYRGV